MKFYIGDDEGHVKLVALKAAPETPAKDDRAMPHGEATRVDGYVPTVATWGAGARGTGVLHMSSGPTPRRLAKETASATVLVAARESGIVDLMDSADGRVLCSYPIFAGQSGNTPERLVGVGLSGETLFAATSRGLLAFINVEREFPVPGDTGNALEPYVLLQTGERELWTARQHPDSPFIVATGGRECDFAIWDVAADVQKQREATGPDALVAAAAVRPHWRAKNVKNDELNLRRPVWVTDVAWLPAATSGSFRVAAATGHGHVRIYDTGATGRRPQHDWAISGVEHPIRRLLVRKDAPEEAFVCDTTGLLLAVSLATGRVTGRFRGTAGAVRDVALPDVQWRLDSGKSVRVLLAVGLDRHLRVFALNSQRRLLGQVFLRQRACCVLAGFEGEEPAPKRAAGESDAEETTDALWSRLAVVESAPPPPKKRAKVGR